MPAVRENCRRSGKRDSPKNEETRCTIRTSGFSFPLLLCRRTPCIPSVGTELGSFAAEELVAARQAKPTDRPDRPEVKLSPATIWSCGNRYDEQGPPIPADEGSGSPYSGGLLESASGAGQKTPPNASPFAQLVWRGSSRGAAFPFLPSPTPGREKGMGLFGIWASPDDHFSGRPTQRSSKPLSCPSSNLSDPRKSSI